MKKILLGLIAAFGLTPPAGALDCRSVTWEDTPFVTCDVDMTTADLRLFHKGEDGQILGQFQTVDRVLQAEGRRLAFAMNAGMYHQDRAPVGLYVERGVQAAPLVTREGPGNFGLLPNGVFCIRPGRADVIESRSYAETAPRCDFATQSGPMLVIDGALHPRFLATSDSRYVRNGVGTTADGRRAVFVIADAPVTFHRFGRFFRDQLGLPNALYFDGNISRLWLPQMRRADFGFQLGPIVGLAVPGS